MDDTTTDTVTEEPSPYLFDVSFDADQIARAEAEAKAKEEEPPEPTFTLLQIDEARKQGYEEGVQAGREEASSSIENSIDQTLQRIAEHLPSLVTAQSVANEQMMANAAEIAVTIMRKLMPTLLERQGAAEIDTLMSDCVSNLTDEPKIRIRVAADHAGEIEKRLEGLVSASGFGGRFLVEPDEKMQPTDCSIDWPGGGMEKKTEEIWAQIDTALDRFLAQYGEGIPDPPAAADAAEEDTTSALDTAQVEADDDGPDRQSANAAAHSDPAKTAAHPAIEDTTGADADNIATDEAEAPQDGTSPQDDQTKAIDPEAPA